MKTIEEYKDLLNGDFKEMVVGKQGVEFDRAIIEFSQKNNLMMSHYDYYKGQAFFFTDRPSNNIGIILLENFKGEPHYFVTRKDEVKRIVAMTNAVATCLGLC